MNAENWDGTSQQAHHKSRPTSIPSTIHMERNGQIPGKAWTNPGTGFRKSWPGDDLVGR